MLNILFICHGNICRSPMAEFVMKYLVDQAGLSDKVNVESAATSTEEIGNDIHYGTRDVLTRHRIPFSRRAARQITAADYNRYDYLIGMDSENLYYMNRRWPSDPERKISLLLEHAGINDDISDPWYTHNFDRTFADVWEGCTGLLEEIKSKINR